VDSAEAVKQATNRAEKDQLITKTDAAEIKKVADKVQDAAEKGDTEAAMEHVATLKDRTEEIVVEKKGPEAAKKIEAAKDKEDMPAINSKEDQKILHQAVARVIEMDPLIKPEDKEEATKFTVEAMTKGFQAAGTTQAQLVNAVEAKATAINKTATDRDLYYVYPATSYAVYPTSNVLYQADSAVYPTSNVLYQADSVVYPTSNVLYQADSVAYASPAYAYNYASPAYSYSYPYSNYYNSYGYPSYYSPYYSYGYGYNQCLYSYSYPYCQGNLYGDYAYYHGFHNFFHNGYGHGYGGGRGHGGSGSGHRRG